MSNRVFVACLATASVLFVPVALYVVAESRLTGERVVAAMGLLGVLALAAGAASDLWRDRKPPGPA